MTKRFIYYLTMTFMSLTGVFFYTPTHAAILFTVDYETGNFQQGPKAFQPSSGFCCSHSAHIVTSPVRGGKYAARYELRDTDPLALNSQRSERVYKGDSRMGKIGGPDEWYGFSIYLPPDYEVDDDPHRIKGHGMSEILAQWHDTPDPGEASKSPPLDISTDLGKWKINMHYSSQAFQTSNNGTHVQLWEAPYQRGVWTDWVVHVKWSYKSDGFIEIWQNGKKVVNYKGPNCYNNKGNNSFQWGIYKPRWKNYSTHVTKRIVYNDELRVGDSNSSYAEVAPRGSTPDLTPPSAPTLSSVANK